MSAMNQPSTSERIREAFARRDLALLAPLLADDVRWGDRDHPRSCRNRAQVLGTFGSLMDEGVEGEVVELAEGTNGILCELAIRWPDGRPGDPGLWHVYLLRDAKIAEIRRYDDRANAANAAGLH
jgi:ketosteroid isomerase-like protein